MPALAQPIVSVIGGGLAGPEAAYQIARAGLPVRLYEMRPRVSTPAHQTGALGELVCSNSLKSEAPDSAPWLLKQELRAAGSLLLHCADQTAIPGGQALTVDRQRFATAIEARLRAQPGLEVRREEVTALAELAPGPVVIASGPLTSAPLTRELERLTGQGGLFFYDAISPIVDAATVNRDRVFAASRYGKGGADDYVNCPLDRDEFDRFYQALRAAASYPLHAFEEPRYFEACLPLEELARRGAETLRYGPMKPVGLVDPRTGRVPYAAVQLRRENLRAESFNLVGFQNHLRQAEQASVLRLIPGLEQARFLRFGQVHRNTYLNAPTLLTPSLELKLQTPQTSQVSQTSHVSMPAPLFVAGQLCGTEGYIEAIATGFVAGVCAARAALGLNTAPVPRASATGSLLHYITASSPQHYAPANMTFDLLPLEGAAASLRDRAARRHLQCERALAEFRQWWAAHRFTPSLAEAAI